MFKPALGERPPWSAVFAVHGTALEFGPARVMMAEGILMTGRPVANAGILLAIARQRSFLVISTNGRSALPGSLPGPGRS